MKIYGHPWSINAQGPDDLGGEGPRFEVALLPIVPVRFQHGADTYSDFSTVTTLGTAQAVTPQELRIECFFPADTNTEQLARRMAA